MRHSPMWRVMWITATDRKRCGKLCEYLSRSWWHSKFIKKCCIRILQSQFKLNNNDKTVLFKLVKGLDKEKPRENMAIKFNLLQVWTWPLQYTCTPVVDNFNQHRGWFYIRDFSLYIIILCSSLPSYQVYWIVNKQNRRHQAVHVAFNTQEISWKWYYSVYKSFRNS